MPRVQVATAMLVALDDALAAQCVTLLDQAGFRVIRVKHVAPALERMPVVMPKLVVVPTTLSRGDEEGIVDRCVAVGAEVLRIPEGTDPDTLAKLLASASQVLGSH